MQRNTFHDIRPKRSVPARTTRATSARSSSQEEERPVQYSNEEKNERPESDFFSYVKEGVAASQKTSRRSDPVPRSVRREPKPIFNTPEFRRVSGKEKERGGNAIWWVASIFLVVFLVLLMNMFQGATVTITPRIETARIDGTFSLAERGTSEAYDIENTVPYQTMVVSVDDEISIPATGEEEVAYRASGRIVVYNAYSTSDQRLVKRTRFEDSAGHVYRINESIVIPGMTEVDGEMIPGSLEVTVYADEPGEEYNIGLSDFTIPGFKESGLTDQYKNFYARSKTEMTGGFVGMQKVAREEDVESARKDLEESLKTALHDEFIASLPDGYIVIQESEIMTFHHADPAEAGGNMVVMASSGTMQAMIASESDIATLVAYNGIGLYAGESIRILDMDDLSVSLVGTLQEEDVAQPATVHISGSASLLWEHDTEEMRGELIGISRNEFDTMMTQYPNIEHISVSMRPFWNSTFPDDADRIHIVQLIDGKKVEE